MIQRMEIFSSRQDAPVLPLNGGTANEDPIQIRDIAGLGPVKAEITTTPFANSDGEILQGISVGKRNPVITVGLNPDWQEQTLADLRQLLYAYFMPKQWVKLRFYTEYLPVVDIEGIVESMEPAIFSKDPEIAISIICTRPDFIDTNPTFLNGVVDNGDPVTEVEFTYEGTVETGFEVRVESSDALPAYTGKILISNQTPSLKRSTIDPVTIDATKKFRLSTIKNAKRAQTVNPDGTTQNILSHVSKASTWPLLQPGRNIISVTADTAGQAWVLAYFNRYGGL